MVITHAMTESLRCIVSTSTSMQRNAKHLVTWKSPPPLPLPSRKKYAHTVLAVLGMAGANQEYFPNPSHLAMTPPMPDYKLMALERDLLQYTKMKDNGSEKQPYTGEIAELCPHLKAATAMAICTSEVSQWP